MYRFFRLLIVSLTLLSKFSILISVQQSIVLHRMLVVHHVTKLSVDEADSECTRIGFASSSPFTPSELIP